MIYLISFPLISMIELQNPKIKVDARDLRHDPVYQQTLANRIASQSTLSRVEHAADRTTITGLYDLNRAMSLLVTPSCASSPRSRPSSLHPPCQAHQGGLPHRAPCPPAYLPVRQELQDSQALRLHHRCLEAIPPCLRRTVSSNISGDWLLTATRSRPNVLLTLPRKRI